MENEAYKRFFPGEELNELEFDDCAEELKLFSKFDFMLTETLRILEKKNGTCVKKFKINKKPPKILTVIFYPVV